MALRPNGRYMTMSTYKGFGVAPGLDARLQSSNCRMNRFVNPSFLKTASTPDGYDMKAVVPPITAGSMASASAKILTLENQNAYMLSGGPVSGTFDMTFTVPDASLSMIVSMSSNTVIVSIGGNGNDLKLTVGMAGEFSMTVSGTNSLSMIVPFEGTGSISLTGTSDLKGLLSLSGEFTPFTELSPENLARSVWEALAADYNDAGTMGSKLNTASSGGVDMNALAQAVWEYATRTLTSGGGSDPWSDPRALTVAKFLGLK